MHIDELIAIANEYNRKKPECQRIFLEKIPDNLSLEIDELKVLDIDKMLDIFLLK